MIRRMLPVAVAILLGGCAHTGIVDDGLSAAQRQARLTAITEWDLAGRIRIDTGERSNSAGVAWRQRGAGLDMTVRGTLGARSFRIQGNEQELTLTQRGETERLTDPERQLSEWLGYWLPVTSLEYWLLGRADPDFPARPQRGASGTLASLEQRDWRIDYTEYQLAEGLLIPRLVSLHYDSLAIDLEIREWQAAGLVP